MMKNYIYFFLILLLLSGCKWFTGGLGSPYFKWTNFKVPPGTPSFQKGFKDGCSSSTYARANVFYRFRYGHRYDPKMIGNSEYRFGYSRGYTWCFQQALAGTSGPVGNADKLLFPGGYDSTFSANSESVGSAWGGFFGGGADTWGGVTNSSGFNGIFDLWQKGATSGGNTAFGNPLWYGGSAGQFFGQ